MRAVLYVICAMVLSGPIGAAELPLPGPAVTEGSPTDCGPCGCLETTYVYHRDLRATYGTSFDPRNYDTTQPHYYFGPMRAYPRYSVNGMPVPGHC
jgi:hypothetical protein